MPEGLLKQPVVYTPRARHDHGPGRQPLGAAGGRGRAEAGLALPHRYAAAARRAAVPRRHSSRPPLQPQRQLLLAGGGRGGQSGCVVLFDVKTGKRIAKIGDELDAVLAADINDHIAWSPSAARARSSASTRPTDGQLLHEIKKHTDWIYAVEFSPDGVLLATGDRSGGLFVWEAETAREYLNLRGHTAGVCDVSWRPDCNVLASASEDTTVRLWEMNDGNQIKSWGAHGGGVFCVNYAHGRPAGLRRPR